MQARHKTPYGFTLHPYACMQMLQGSNRLLANFIMRHELGPKHCKLSHPFSRVDIRRKACPGYKLITSKTHVYGS